MTVLDANNLLFEWFGSNDSFVMERDFKKVVPIFEDEEEMKTTLNLALQELCEANLVKICENKKYYILTKPFGAYQQSPEINSWIANYASVKINEFCDLINDDSDRCDASNLCEKDVKNLCHIIVYYRDALTKIENEK